MSRIPFCVLACLALASCKPRVFNSQSTGQQIASDLEPLESRSAEAYWGEFAELEALRRQARVDIIEGHYNESPRCKTTDDLFETGAQIVSKDSASNGRCIDQRLFRTVRILSDAQKKLFGFAPEALVLANVHGVDPAGQNTWMLAVVDLAALDDVHFQVLERKTIMDRHHPSHSQMMARFTRPVKLYRQYDPQTRKPDTSRVLEEVDHLVLSVQAGHGPGGSDDLRLFMDGTFPLIYGVFTPQFKFWLGFVGPITWAPITRLPQVPIGRDREEKQAFVRTYFEYGHGWNLATPFSSGGIPVGERVFFRLADPNGSTNLGDPAAGFNMMQRSCSNSAFRIIDSVLRERRSAGEQEEIQRRIGLAETIPGLAWEGLAKRGLMSSADAQYHPTNVEDYVADPSFVEMIRQHGLKLSGNRETLQEIVSYFDRKDIFESMSF